METRIWVRPEEKFTEILVLKGDQVHFLKVTGLMLKRKVQGILEQLEAGADPAEVGGKKHQAIEVATIAKAAVSPSNGSVKLHRESDGAVIKFTTPNDDADAILATILERNGRTFQSSTEEIGLVEALIGPALYGVIAGLFWLAVSSTADELAQGHEVEVKGRRQGMKQSLVKISGWLGPTGATILGLVLLALLLAWAGSRIFKRPVRTVWLPGSNSSHPGVEASPTTSAS